MRLAAFVILLLCLSIASFLLGKPSAALQMFGQQNNDALALACPTNQTTVNGSPTGCQQNSFLNQIGNAMTSDAVLVLLGLGIAGLVARTLIGGFGATFVIPLVLGLVILNFVFVPISLFVDNSIPDMIRIPLLLTFNVLGILAIVGFIRGSI